MPAQVLTDLPPGSGVLIDANIFVYAFLEISRQCVEFLRRCSSEDVLAVTTADVVSDVCHRLMLAEAVATGVIPRQSAPALKRKPESVRSLSRYWPLTAGVFQLGILILELDDTRLQQAHQMIERHGLLTKDSLVLAAADEYGLEALASLDSDFDNIDWLTVYKPTDVP
jgi:predicted nucleic acid-binding protein